MKKNSSSQEKVGLHSTLKTLIFFNFSISTFILSDIINMRLHYFIFLCIISIACVSGLPVKKGDKESKQVSNAVPAAVENEVVSNQADADDDDDDEDIEEIFDDDDDDDDDADDGDDAADDDDGEEDDEDYLEVIIESLMIP